MHPTSSINTYSTCIRAGTKVGKQSSKFVSKKEMKFGKFACVFINVVLNLIGLHNWIIAL